MPADVPRGNGPADVPLRIGRVRRTTILSVVVGDNGVETSLCDGVISKRRPWGIFRAYKRCDDTFNYRLRAHVQGAAHDDASSSCSGRGEEAKGTPLLEN